eukprot:CAMPEP_0113541372 /NCGR_PEP_ID=MMETSP0015_2-20120614/8995_1 /TAXON_ID=2838 /ORGANISM="Odontella" /LENGTH=390 /DNA_ID=CAMNT_0000441271 /DNA_START=144 /DNA_END=1313 /DNA_ORIENTATION=- /assembly_acc=CAM_ASM_000160
MPPSATQNCKYAPVAPADGAREESYLHPGPSSGGSRWQDVLKIATVVALSMLVTYQAAEIYRSGGGAKQVSGGDVFSGGDCPYSPKSDPNPDMKGPKVVWRMSFPNSGTSYTGKVIKNLSNYTSATTYGKEGRLDDRGYTVPLREDSPEGPFLSHFIGNGVPNYVLTKTHCGGRCFKCGPDKYIETQESFERACRTGGRIEPGKDGKGSKKVKTRYSTDIIQRAVHVIRDPFDNIVSRFHLERHSYMRENDTEWLEKYSTDFDGFQAYCQTIDERYVEEEEDNRFLGDDVRALFEGIPCHGDFFKYAQWHTLAVATRDRLRLPTHVLYYENFDSDFDGTVNALLEFLELERVGPPKPDFIKGKTYRNLYTEEQRVKVMKLIHRVVSADAW